MRNTALIAVAAFSLGLATMALIQAQEAPPEPAPAGTLTAMDYIEIEQLANRYGLYIDTCTNNGYDYADLYTEDGIFIDSFTDEGFAQGGLQRAEGRDELAAAAGGGALGCQNVGWKDWSHLTVNHVITPSAEGATGKVYSVVIGEKGPDHTQRFGGYEDVYVRTPNGWRIKQRTHVRNKAWSNPLLQSEDLN